MISVKEKIKTRMDHLQQCMEGQAHIDRPDYVKDVIDTVSKFWSVLSEEDRDYVQAAIFALEEKKQWA
jgi:uncharacterized protein YydD (DUF2326 family)